MRPAPDARARCRRLVADGDTPASLGIKREGDEIIFFSEPDPDQPPAAVPVAPPPAAGPPAAGPFAAGPSAAGPSAARERAVITIQACQEGDGAAPLHFAVKETTKMGKVRL